LKSDPSLFDTHLSGDSDNSFIQPLTLNFTTINTLCNTLLDNNLDLAARLVEENKTELFAGENQVNLLARMFNGKDMTIWLYQMSLKYNPDSWETYFSLGSVYKENGETILATNALLKAQKINPENTSITDLLNEISRTE